MNLQERSSDASQSERIIWHPKFEELPTKSNKVPFYEAIMLNASPHDYMVYELAKARQKMRRSDLFNDFRQQIIEMQNLLKGWDSYNADPPNYKALTNSIKTLDTLYFILIYEKHKICRH